MIDTFDYTEKRKYKREIFNMPVEFSLNTVEFHELKKISTTGIAVDVSECGIGLITEFPIEAGHVIIFKKEVENLKTPGVGIVKWVSDEGRRTRAGVQFCGILRCD